MRKKFFLLAVFALWQITSYAQNSSKNVSYTLSDGTVVNETVVDGIKNGVSEMIDAEGKVLSRGKYKNDFKTGNWFFFTKKDSLYLKYNYDEKKILFFDPSKLYFVNVEIDTKDEKVKKGASIPLPLISIDEYISLLDKLIESKLSNELKLRGEGKYDIEVVATVNNDGKAKYSLNYKLYGKPFSKKIDQIDDKIIIDWIPASYEKTSLNSKFIVKLSYDFETSSGHKRFSWN